MAGPAFRPHPLAIAVALVAGCSSHTQHDTGRLRCAGLCELVVDHKEHRTTTSNDDGTEVTEQKESTGLGGAE